MRFLLTTALLLASCLSYGFNLGEFSLEDFASLPGLRDVKLSPRGTFLSSIVTMQDGLPTIVIQNLDDPEETPFPIQTGKWHINWTRWISDHQFLISINTPLTMGGTPVTVTRLIAADAKARTAEMMFAREKGRGFIQIQDKFLATDPEKPGQFLIAASTTDPSRPAVKLVKPSATRLPKKDVQKPGALILDWQADKNAQVRVAHGTNRDQSESILRLKDAEGEWHDHSHLSEGSCEVMALPTDRPDIVYVQCPDNNGYGEVKEFNVISGEFGARIAGQPYTDVAAVVLNAAGTEIDAVYYESDDVSNDYVQPVLKRLKKIADANFPDTHNYLSSWSEDYSKALIGAVSDELPHHYYLFDGKKKSLDYYHASYPNLVYRAPGRVHRIEYEARDGLVIPAYITLPKMFDLESAKDLPFVVHPHGGPHARDLVTFDWLTQMLTAAGYGVLQMNFRGSTGYGLEFKKAGEKQWGQAMQDDITDGTKWLVEQGLADPQRICIFGGSYGGYAALMGAVKTPDLFKCAASLNGVSDLADELRADAQYIGGKYATRHIGKLWKDRKMLRENSPRHRADEITIPVLLVHGEDDRVVRVSQSRRMARTLGEDRLWRYVELPDGTHSLSHQENRIAFARVLLEFFSAHL